jgi:hypothetical protein
MKKKAVKKEDSTIRVCANIRSRKHPDVRCTLVATNGEFCTRHTKNPVRFQEKLNKNITETNVIGKEFSTRKIQKMWRQYIIRHRIRNQGLGAFFTNISENNTEIYTLESVDTIPHLYRWSYQDNKKHVWVFDIRSLHTMQLQKSRENPYTREQFTEKAENHFKKRTLWLLKRKYCLFYTNTEELTPEQQWHQRILDVTMKYDMLGYYMCIHWFDELSDRQFSQIYTELWELWNFRLQLSSTLKRAVVPNWNKDDSLLFKWIPVEIKNRREKKWWQKILLDIFDRLVSGETKESRSMGALYGMTAFAIVSPSVRTHYSWLVQEPSGF